LFLLGHFGFFLKELASSGGVQYLHDKVVQEGLVEFVVVVDKWSVQVVRECHGFSKPAGFATGFPGVRVGVQTFVPRKNPYPWHGYTGLMAFQTPLEIARECQLITHFRPLQLVNHHHNPRNHEQGQERMGNGWCIHPFLKRYVIYLFNTSSIYANLQLYRIHVVPHISPPSKMSARARFRWWLIVFHHHQATTIENEHARARF
jgi:hypothetical protein